MHHRRMTSPLLIGLSARIYTPGSAGVELPGVWTKTLHYLEQSAAHWVLSGGAMAVMVPAVTTGSVVLRSDIDLKCPSDAPLHVALLLFTKTLNAVG